MSTESLPTGPDPDDLIRLIRETWPDATVATMEGAAFFSLDERHWPNFATVVWTDDFDESALEALARGVYRLNSGSGRSRSSAWSAQSPSRTTRASIGSSRTRSTPSSTGSRS
jgi:uncharacterized protein DUF6194